MANLTFEIGDSVRHTSKHVPWVGQVSEVKPTMPYPYYVKWCKTEVNDAFTGVHLAVELVKRKGLGD